MRRSQRVSQVPTGSPGSQSAQEGHALRGEMSPTSSLAGSVPTPGDGSRQRDQLTFTLSPEVVEAIEAALAEEAGT